MSVKDIIKNSVYESFASGSGLSFWSVCLILILSCFIGLYIFFVYKLFTKSAFYSKDLNITLTGMTIVIAAIMIAMQSNLLVSLGMVGALSIVRFRTAVKNPLDLLYLFWAISAGIICGVGLYVLAIVLCIIMTIIIYLLNRLPSNKAPTFAVIRVSHKCKTDKIYAILNENSKHAKENSIIVKNGQKEIIFELISPTTEKIIEQLNEIEEIISVNILQHTGEARV